MKTLHLFLMLLVLSLTALAQQEEKGYVPAGTDYRSTANKYYWKNRPPFPGYWQQDVDYTIVAKLDDSLDVIDGELTLTYFNNSPDILPVVYFHLYQNAFMPGSYYDNLQKNNSIVTVYGRNEKDKKCEEVESVLVNNVPVTPVMDNTIMKITLPQALPSGGSVVFKIKFKTYFGDGGNVRRRMKMFRDAWGNKQFDGVHWYPRICVYDRKFGWETDQHLGREFYGDFGTFDVKLTLPDNYINEATGELQNENEVLPTALRRQLDVKNFAGKPFESKPSLVLPRVGTKTWHYKAINTHDFAFTCDPTYRIDEASWNGIRCIGLVQEPHAGAWQGSGGLVADIIKTYSTDFGMYAYPKMVAADARDGMEYPMLTLDGGASPTYTNLFSHEIGHNWFFGMVGNNETYRAALDEGFTQFLTSWYMSKQEANKRLVMRYKNAYVAKYVYTMTQRDQVAYSAYMYDAMNDADETINQHSDGFNGAINHGGGYRLVYFKTATMLWNLQYVLGDSLFLKAIQNYFNEYKMAHPYFEDFRSSVIHYTHVDLNWFFDQWMETSKHIDYEIERVKHKGGDQFEITFEREGRMQMPVDFTVTARDGRTYDFIIPNTYFVKQTNATVLPYWKGWDLLQPTYTCIVSIPGGIKNVEIDPSHRLADIDRTNNTLRCPYVLTFDHQILNPGDFYHYVVKWRPDIWGNANDGLKLGLHVSSNYMNRKENWDATVWWNSGIMRHVKEFEENTGRIIDKHNLLSYRVAYRDALGRDFSWNISSRYLDGLFANRIGLDKRLGEFNLYINYNTMYRWHSWEKGYLNYPELWASGLWNNFINAGFHNTQNYGWGYANQNLNFRSSAMGSNHLYGNISFTRVDNITKRKFDLKVRSFIQYGIGTHPLESSLMLAGANNESMMDSKFTRSIGFVPSDWLGYGSDINHFQQGGGLNIRGFAGYLAPVGDTVNQYRLFMGNSGAAINAELDFERIFNIHPKKLKDYLELDVYAFADAGYIADRKATGQWFFANAFRTDAGLGTALNIKRFWFLSEIRPLTIRIDFPVLISPSPASTNNFAMRYVVGIGRCF